MEPVSLFYEKRAQLLLKNLRARHFDACYCPNRTSALAAALRLIPQGSLVGWGGARSADQIGLQQALRDGPWRVIDRESMQTDAEREQAAHDCLSADFFLTGRECRQPYGRTGEYRRQGKPRCCHCVRSARDHRDRRDEQGRRYRSTRPCTVPERSPHRRMSSAFSARRRARRPAAVPTATARSASAIRSSSRETAVLPDASMSSSSARSLASEQNWRKKSEPPLSERGLRVLPRVSRLPR